MLHVLIAISLLAAGGGSFGGFGGFIGGGQFPAIDEVNSVLSDHGIPEISSPVFSTGGGGYALIGNIFIGGSGYGGKATSKTSNLTVETSIGGGAFEFGYQRLLLRSLLGYVFLGIGGYGITMELRPKLADASFGEVIDSPQRMSIISIAGFAFETALALHYWIPMGKKPSFLSLMLKGGAQLLPSPGDWKLRDGAEVTTGPSIGKAHPFISVGVFFGGRVPASMVKKG